MTKNTVSVPLFIFCSMGEKKIGVHVDKVCDLKVFARINFNQNILINHTITTKISTRVNVHYDLNTKQ